MPLSRALGVLCFIALAAGGNVYGWSILDEVTILDPTYSASLVWELVDSKPYCSSDPNNLDRLACELVPDPAEVWIGIDSAGNRYGIIIGVDPNGEYFDLYRRLANTNFDTHIIRFTKRVEPVFGEVTKLNVTSRWEVDVTSGEILVTLTGSCLSSTCVAQSDTLDHLAMIKISGLPPLLALEMTYEPPASIAFLVPTRPEGLPSGDSFDVYTGDLGTLPDLSLAQPMACDAAPGALPGTPVTVSDPLPDPPSGQTRYYLTTVTSGMQRRAGRQSIAGTLSGRDTTGLPVCTIP